MTFTPNKWPMLSRPIADARLRTISLGVGVQSVTLALMAARGDIGPMPDVAIFADTGGEGQRTYAYLEWLREQVPFPIVTARRPGLNLADLAIAVAQGEHERAGTALPPWYFEGGMLRKHCSGEFKREVVVREIRAMLGLKKGQRLPKGEPIVETWIGMTTDEMTRVATARQPWIHNRHPLVECDMSRNDCIAWLSARQYPVPPKSSCVYCPFRRNDQWRELRDNAPEDFAEACRVDSLIRPGFAGMTGEAFVHRQCVPLAEADLGDNSDQGALPFMADCESCGI